MADEYGKILVTLPTAMRKHVAGCEVKLDDGRMLLVKHVEVRTNLKDSEMEMVLVLGAESFEYAVEQDEPRK